MFSGKHVLTAAHCCSRHKDYVHLGENLEFKVKITETKHHPKFETKSFHYDLCVVTLEKDVTIDEKIKDHVEVVLLPNARNWKDCDAKSFDMDATGFGYWHGCN